MAIGMADAQTPDAAVGLGFPRNPADAVRVATSFWNSVNRRDFLTGTGFAVSAFTTPVTRWLVTPADDDAAHRGRAADIAELREAAADVRQWDSKCGGGNWKASSVTACLQERAVPLLNGSFSDDVGRELFSVTAELFSGWSAGQPSTSASTTPTSGTSSRPSASLGPVATSSSAAMS